MATPYGEQLEEQDFKSSKYNSGFLVILRINELWKDANRYARNSQYSLWNEVLDRIWLELIGDIPPKDRKAKEEENKKLVLKYASSYISEDRSDNFKGKSINERMSLALRKAALMEREAFLRILQNEQKKGTAYDEGIDAYMDN